MIPEALRLQYRGLLPGRLERIDALLAAGDIAELVRELHTIGGSAGTFDLEKVGDAARAAEDYLRSCGGQLDAGQRAELDRLLAILRHEACTA